MPNTRFLKKAEQAKEEGCEPDDDNVTALDCGQLRPNTGYLEKAHMDAPTNKSKVFARARPGDNLEIVKSLHREAGEGLHEPHRGHPDRLGNHRLFGELHRPVPGGRDRPLARDVPGAAGPRGQGV